MYYATSRILNPTNKNLTYSGNQAFQNNSRVDNSYKLTDIDNISTPLNTMQYPSNNEEE